MNKFPDLPPIWLLGAVALVWALGRWLPLWRLEGLWAPGAALIFAGVVLIVWSALWFKRKRTSIEPGQKPKALIFEGPYRLSRNPIYLGMAVILTGAVVWAGAVSGLLVLPGFIAIITRRFIWWEEAALTAAFGAEAEAYLAATRRWV